jgi:ribose 5-phosphate isomerase A
MNSYQSNIKMLLGSYIAKHISNNQVISVGTGTTVEYAIKEMGVRIANEDLKVQFITTSFQSATLLGSYGLSVLHPSAYPFKVDWGFDGADEIDERGYVIKGKGGAMLKEKIAAKFCTKFSIVADESKLVEKLGIAAPVPVEAIPESIPIVKNALLCLGAKEVALRDGMPGKHGPVITEAGNLILDAYFSDIKKDLEEEIKKITGVVESGLFIDCIDEIIVGYSDGSIKTRKITI